MPSDRDLDEIRQYFANLSPDEFDRDFAGASPSVPPEAVDRPPVRGPHAPAQSLNSRPPLEEETVDDLKKWVARLVDQRIAETLSQVERTRRRVISSQQRAGSGAIPKGRRGKALKRETPADQKPNWNPAVGQNKLPTGTVDVPLENRSRGKTVKTSRYVN
jgi:hypothetical protein